MNTISKCLLHSTESQGWPSYPTFAPQFTYDPWKHAWRQHMPLPRSASTLADPSWTAVRENRDDVVQVEIVGYCDPQRWPSYGHNVEKMDDRALRDLGEFIAWLHREWDVPLTAIPTDEWVSYPKSYGVNAAQRLNSTQFDTFKGALGHQHASGNHHGDPGRIAIAKIMLYALGEDEDDDMPTAKEIADELATNQSFLQAVAKAVWQKDETVHNVGFAPASAGRFVSADAALQRILQGIFALPNKVDEKLADDFAKLDSGVTIEHASPPS